MNIYINFVIFRTRGKHYKMFSAENIFRENDFYENIYVGNHFPYVHLIFYVMHSNRILCEKAKELKPNFK
jgi:hypothetical protein